MELMYLKCYIDCTFRLQILKTFEYLHLYLLSLPCTLPRLSFPLIILTIYIIYFLWFRKIYHIDFFQIYENILIHVPPSLSLSHNFHNLYYLHPIFQNEQKNLCHSLLQEMQDQDDFNVAWREKFNHMF